MSSSSVLPRARARERPSGRADFLGFLVPPRAREVVRLTRVLRGSYARARGWHKGVTGVQVFPAHRDGDSRTHIGT